MNRGRTTIRLARRADAEELAALSRDTIEAGLPWRWRPARIEAFIASARHNIIVAEKQGRRLGFAVMGYDDSEAYLALLAVAPEARRGGIARQMLAWLLKTADVAGIATLSVELREDNSAAQRLYEEAGFVLHDRKIGGYYGRVNQIRMRLALRPQETPI